MLHSACACRRVLQQLTLLLNVLEEDGSLRLAHSTGTWRFPRAHCATDIDAEDVPELVENFEATADK